ncbi:MAG: DNA integrity scanning diadenylate cyclase DisA [Candidatus Pacearchaeota archaeon]|nr:DNA integrity scanning diadenylate cyclase DisA [Candidatus Pacearchaeota archaeon]
MIEKKDVQVRLLKEKNNGDKATKEEINNLLRIVSPGTHFRNALEGILQAKKGALIVVETNNIQQIIDGGFKINAKFSPQKLIELSKMDGAIILSKDMKRISHANVTLYPDKKIQTNETGTRHKAAERTAKMMNNLVVAASERKGEITIYFKNYKHILKNTNELLRKVNEQIQIIEKQRELFDNNITQLNKLEIRNYLNLKQATQTIQRGRLIEKIAQDMKPLLVEIGNEGTLIKTRLKELLSNIEKETNLIIKDYTKIDLKKSRILIDSLTYDELTDSENVISALAYEKDTKIERIRGWRILSKTSLEDQDIAILTKELDSLGKTLYSNANIYKKIIGEEKAKTFKEEIEKIKLNF